MISNAMVPESIKVPPEGHLYEPSPYIIFHGKGKSCQRFIFRNQQLTEFENEKLSRLEAELQKLNINIYELHPN